MDYINNEINKICQKKNLIEKIFEIEITTSTKCKVLSCLNVSNNIEKSTILMLNLNSECSNLDDCYNFSNQRIKLDGEEKYYCEKCEKKRVASQRKEITKWPKNIIIWLRRFEQVGNRFSKFSQEIEVPIVWKNNYKLKGIVLHSGSLRGGHYVYAGKQNDKWYLFNDSSVGELNNSSLLNIINNGYIYYYDKCDSHMDTMMSRCQNLTAGSFKTFFDDFQKIHLENMKEMNDGMGAFMFNMAFGKDSEFPYPIRFMHALHRYTC